METGRSVDVRPRELAVFQAERTESIRVFFGNLDTTNYQNFMKQYVDCLSSYGEVSVNRVGGIRQSAL